MVRESHTVTVAQSSGRKAATERLHKSAWVDTTVRVRARAGTHVKLCNEVQLLTFMAVFGLQCPDSLNF